MTALRYNLRFQVNMATALVMAVPLLIPVIMSPQMPPLVYTELFFPAIAPVVMAGLISREWEAGTADVLLARPVARWWLLTGRVLTAVAILLGAYVAGWGVITTLGRDVNLGDMLAVVLPGALALGSVGLAVATISRSSPTGYLVPLSYWMFDWLTQGTYTGRFYLLKGLGTDKWYLVGAAGAALLLTWLWLSRRER